MADLTPKARIETRISWGSPSIAVHVEYPNAGVDRPDTYSMSCPSMTLAKRLAAAIDAGKAIGSRIIHTDIHGKTYVHGSIAVLGRTLNADLKKLGF